MSGGRSGASGRFTLLSLEENEYYFEDIGCTAGYPAVSEPPPSAQGSSSTPTSHIASPTSTLPYSSSLSSPTSVSPPQRNTFKGRLHICSHCVYFEPEDLKQPIVKIPFANVRSISEQATRRVVANSMGLEPQSGLDDDWGSTLLMTSSTTRGGRRNGSMCGDDSIVIETTTAMTLVPNQPHRAVRLTLPQNSPFSSPDQNVPYYGIDFTFTPTYAMVETVLPLIRCLHAIRLLALKKPGADELSSRLLSELFASLNLPPPTTVSTSNPDGGSINMVTDPATLAQSRLQEVISVRLQHRTFDLTEVSDFSETPINVRAWLIGDGLQTSSTQQLPYTTTPSSAMSPSVGVFARGSPSPMTLASPTTGMGSASSATTGAGAAFALPVHLVTPLVSSPGLLLLSNKTIYFQSVHADIEAEPVKKIPLAMVSHILTRRHATRDCGLEVFVDTTTAGVANRIESNRRQSADTDLKTPLSEAVKMSLTSLSSAKDDDDTNIEGLSLSRVQSTAVTSTADIRALLSARHSFFFVFSNKATRNAFMKAVRAQPSFQPRKQLEFPAVLRAWVKGEVSNYLYLLYLNLIAGRSFKDLAQYPVFPWVLSDYVSDTIDLEDPSIYRDLSKPVGALNPTRLAQLKKRMELLASAYAETQTERAHRAVPQTEIEKFEAKRQLPFLYGTHFSAPGYVVHFLLRACPAYMLRLQGGKFDHPDRLFVSVAATWASCLTNNADVKELIPEFYTVEEDVENSTSLNNTSGPVDGFGRLATDAFATPSYGFEAFGSTSLSPNRTFMDEGSKSSVSLKVVGLSGAAGNVAAVRPPGRFLENALQLQLGTTQNGIDVSDVELPPWARLSGPSGLVATLRAALEHEHCSSSLHSWIDLIFGYKQTGAAAVAADNLFYPLTYPHNINLDAITDPAIRHGLETQVLEFGQMPAQLFSTPHPSRGSAEEEVEAFLKEWQDHTSLNEELENEQSKPSQSDSALRKSPVPGLELVANERDNVALLASPPVDDKKDGNAEVDKNAVDSQVSGNDSEEPVRSEETNALLEDIASLAISSSDKITRLDRSNSSQSIASAEVDEMTIEDATSSGLQTIAGAASVLAGLDLSGNGNVDEDEEAELFRTISRLNSTSAREAKSDSEGTPEDADKTKDQHKSSEKSTSEEGELTGLSPRTLEQYAGYFSRWDFWKGLSAPCTKLPTHRGGIVQSHLSLNGDVLYSLTKDGIIKVHSELYSDEGPHQLRQTAVSSCPLTCVSTVDAAGHFALVGAADNSLYLYGRLSGSVLGHAENAHDSIVSSVAVVNDSLAVTGGLDSVVRAWHLSPMGVERAGNAVCTEHTSSVRCVDVDRFERPLLVASGADDGRSLLWDLNSFESLSLPMIHSSSSEVMGAYPSPQTITALKMQGDYLVVGNAEGIVRTWSLRMPTAPVTEFRVPGGGAITSLVLNPSHRVLSSLGLEEVNPSLQEASSIDGVLVGTNSGLLALYGCPHIANDAHLWTRQFNRPIASLSLSFTSGLVGENTDDNGFAGRAPGSKLAICFDPAFDDDSDYQTLIFDAAKTSSQSNLNSIVNEAENRRRAEVNEEDELP